jgi:hypothetical protein
VSRSYRKPYTAITGLPRSHDDKKKASRGVRSRQNAWLRNLKDYDLALIPHRHECAFNNTYLWARDGKQFLVSPHSRMNCSDDLARNRWIKLRRK